jgi:glycogen debranching enzyme
MAQSTDELIPERRTDAPPSARGGELSLPSSRDTEQLVCARGSLFLVTERHGDISPPGARELGLFQNDTRFLSQLELRIADLELLFLSSETSHDAFSQVDLMVSGLEPGEFLDDPKNFLHIRRRQLLDGGLLEEITLTNFLNRAVSLTLDLAFDADFADIFEVRGAKRLKRGVYREPRATSNSVVHAYDGLDGIRYSTELMFAPEPHDLQNNRAQYRLEIVAGGSQQLQVSVVPQHNARRRWVPHTPFNQRVGRQIDQARGFREASSRIRCDNAVLERVFERAVRDLHAMRVRVGSCDILAAGIPWFCCPFGRDSLIASYAALTLQPELASQSLRVLAGFQGKRDNDVTEEEPGKIFHELRFGELANTGEMPHSPYYGSVDATPLFVIAIEATYRVTGDLKLVRELREPLLGALGWIDRKSNCGANLVSYERVNPRGLDNQGWKDSRAGVSFPDGRRAASPIALCEVQGYCVDAYARGGLLLELLGEPALAQTYAARAGALRALTNERMWLEDRQRYAFAIDGQGMALDTIVSNVGHLLWSQVPSQAQALATADLLLAPESFSGFGIRTLATGQPVYNPLSYHNGTVWPHDNALIAQGFANYGLTQHAARVFDGMIRAMGYFRDQRLPELFCGMPSSQGGLVRYPVACSPQAWASAAPYLLLRAALGLHIDAPQRRLEIRNAHLPDAMQWVDIEGLWIGASRVSLRLRRGGSRVHVERLDVSGPAIRTEVAID